MKTDKTKLLQDIEAMKAKLASMEEELNKPETFKHFPSKGDEYYYYDTRGNMWNNDAFEDDLKVNVFKTRTEAEKAYNKAVAIEKVKRRLLELQGNWKPNWKDSDEKKAYICYYYHTRVFGPSTSFFSQTVQHLPYMKSKYIANTIIKEMEDELKLIFGIV